jgi:hypothetical protein
MSDVVLQLNFTGLLLEGDENGWIQLLVLGVLFGFSVLSGIVRSRKQRRNLEREERPVSTPPAIPLRRQKTSRTAQEMPAAGPLPPEQSGETRPEPPGRAKPRTIIRPGSALGAFVAEIKAEIKRASEEMQGISIPPEGPVPTHKPKRPAAAPPAAPPLQDAPAHPLLRETAPAEPDDLPDILPAFSGPDDLRTAIIYYEILGKPLSLRGTSDHLIGL